MKLFPRFYFPKAPKFLVINFIYYRFKKETSDLLVIFSSTERKVGNGEQIVEAQVEKWRVFMYGLET